MVLTLNLGSIAFYVGVFFTGKLIRDFYDFHKENKKNHKPEYKVFFDHQKEKFYIADVGYKTPKRLRNNFFMTKYYDQQKATYVSTILNNK